MIHLKLKITCTFIVDTISIYILLHTHLESYLIKAINVYHVYHTNEGPLEQVMYWFNGAWATCSLINTNYSCLTE